MFMVGSDCGTDCGLSRYLLVRGSAAVSVRGTALGHWATNQQHSSDSRQNGGVVTSDALIMVCMCGGAKHNTTQAGFNKLGYGNLTMLKGSIAFGKAP